MKIRRVTFIIFLLCALVILMLNVCAAAAEFENFDIELVQEGKFPEITEIKDSDKETFEIIRNALYEHKNEFTIVYDENIRCLAKLYENVINDSPELYYVLGTVSICRSAEEYTIRPNYRTEEFDTELFSTSNSAAEAINDILAQIQKGMTDLDKVIAVHDYIVNHYEYDYTYTYYYANEFFKYKRGVCNAHALAFKQIMDRLGIKCTLASSKQMNHVWNMVYINGNYYHLDLTWDEGSWEECGYVSHKYFMLSDTAMSDESHKHYGWSASAKASDTTYDTYFWTRVYTPMQYYDGLWYMTEYYGLYRCSVIENSKEKILSGAKTLNIYNGTLYFTSDNHGAICIIPIDKLSDGRAIFAEPVGLNVKTLNGMYIEEGKLVYALAEEEFYERETGSDGLPHAVHKDYYNYRKFYYKDLTNYNGIYKLGDDIKWSIDNNGVLKISGTGILWGTSQFKQRWGYLTDSVKSVIIGSGINCIDQYAFWGMKNLERVELPDTVTDIYQCAFDKCTKLSDINIPESVKRIYASAFRECASLSYIKIPAGVKEVHGAFANCDKLKTAGPIGGGYNYEYGWTESIPKGAFRGCTSLNKVVIPESITMIGAYAFNSSGISEIVIPENVTEIGDCAFSYCKELTELVLPDSVTKIGSNLCANCDSLTKIKFSKYITEIPSIAIVKCNNLQKIILPRFCKKVISNAFVSNEGLTELYVPSMLSEMKEYAFSYPEKMIIYGKKNSYAELYAKLNKMNFSAIDIPITELSFADESVTVGKNKTFIEPINILPEFDTDTIKFTSSDESVAQVSDIGEISTKAAGTAVITAKAVDGGAVAECIINVMPDPEITLFTCDKSGTADISSVGIPDGAEVFIAGYEDSGRMSAIKRTVLTDGRAQMVIPLENVSEIKAFIWDLKGVRPLAESKTVKISEIRY